MHLGFDNETTLIAQRLCNFEGFLRRSGERALLDVDAERGHEFLGVVLVEIEEPDWVGEHGLVLKSCESALHLWLINIFI